MVRNPSTEAPAHRVTIMISDVLDRKVRNRQAKLIQQDQSTHSYSSVINEALAKQLK